MLNTNLGSIYCIEINNTLGADAYGKPWLLIKDNWDSIKIGRIVGVIYAGASYSITGNKGSDEYGTFLIHSYTIGEIYHVFVSKKDVYYAKNFTGTYTMVLNG